jgi:DNA-binding PadR family transcriptional regulator
MAKEETTKLSAIDEDILTVLVGRELYGLEILDLLNQGRAIPLSFGSLYPAMNRLEKKKLVKWHWGDEDQTTGGARRKYYEVTAFGETALREVQEYRQQLAWRPAQATNSLAGA